jgi:hypothetical protein
MQEVVTQIPQFVVLIGTIFSSELEILTRLPAASHQAASNPLKEVVKCEQVQGGSLYAFCLHLQLPSVKFLHGGLGSYSDALTRMPWNNFDSIYWPCLPRQGYCVLDSF